MLQNNQDQVLCEIMSVRDFFVGVGLSSKDIPAFRFPLGVGVNAIGEVSHGCSEVIRVPHLGLYRVRIQGMLPTQ